MRIHCDFRDHQVYAPLGRLSEALVPPVPIAPSRSPENVREIPDTIMTWLATGDRTAAFEQGTYPRENAPEIGSAVRRVAMAWQAHGGRLLGGDDQEWRRAADLTVTREWKRS